MLLFLLLGCLAVSAQDLTSILKRGQEVFQVTCSSGYCHGLNGIGAGGPRLADRGFDQAHLNATISRGIPGTSMPAFVEKLSAPDRIAVIAYVAKLNGIVEPNVTSAREASVQPVGPTLSTLALQGRALFYDQTRSSGFGRCSTCHQVNGVGIPVTTAITSVPRNVSALRALETPRVQSITLNGDRSPALVVSRGSRRTIYYDLSLIPPVQRQASTVDLLVVQGGPWSHSSVIGAYDDSELQLILIFLREVITL